MVMAWRFGAVGIESVMAVIAEADTFGEWTAAVPSTLRADGRWPQDGSVIRREAARQSRGRHAVDGHLIVAIVESWRPGHELVLRVRGSFGGWVRLTIR